MSVIEFAEKQYWDCCERDDYEDARYILVASMTPLARP